MGGAFQSTEYFPEYTRPVTLNTFTNTGGDLTLAVVVITLKESMNFDTVYFTLNILTLNIFTNTGGYVTLAVVVMTLVVVVITLKELMYFDKAYLTLENLLCTNEKHPYYWMKNFKYIFKFSCQYAISNVYSYSFM